MNYRTTRMSQEDYFKRKGYGIVVPKFDDSGCEQYCLNCSEPLEYENPETKDLKPNTKYRKL